MACKTTWDNTDVSVGGFIDMTAYVARDMASIKHPRLEAVFES